MPTQNAVAAWSTVGWWFGSRLGVPKIQIDCSTGVGTCLHCTHSPAHPPNASRPRRSWRTSGLRRWQRASPTSTSPSTPWSRVRHWPQLLPAACCRMHCLLAGPSWPAHGCPPPSCAAAQPGLAEALLRACPASAPPLLPALAPTIPLSVPHFACACAAVGQFRDLVETAERNKALRETLKQVSLFLFLLYGWPCVALRRSGLPVLPANRCCG